MSEDVLQGPLTHIRVKFKGVYELAVSVKARPEVQARPASAKLLSLIIVIVIVVVVFILLLL